MTDLLTGAQRNFLQERVVYGRPAAEVIAEEASNLGKRKVFIVTSRSLSGDNSLARQIGAALGERFAGLYGGVTAHTPRSCVIDGAALAREANADLLVAVGGGSVVDATKAMLLCLWNNVTTTTGMDPFRGRREGDPSRWPDDAASRIRMLAVPTMFSAAEFTWFAGVTDPARLVKESFSHPLFVPQVVVLDPAATLTAPIPNLLATGMKAVDHAVERLCALRAPPLIDATASKALKLLHSNLPKLANDHAGDLALRLDCQFGMWLSIYGSGVAVGASHAIGHVIGGYGVPHGHTTGVLLPSVLRWNYSANADRQALAAAIIGTTGDKLADTILGFAKQLGVPTSLREVGIKRDDLDDIADKSLRDPPMKTNPRKVSSAEEIREILEMAW